MATVFGLAVLAALLMWLLGAGRGGAAAAPEDDVDTPVDEEELRAAERELRADPEARPIHDAFDDDDDDWGPGTSKSHIPEF
jgi:hypothetical protein